MAPAQPTPFRATWFAWNSEDNVGQPFERSDKPREWEGLVPSALLPLHQKERKQLRRALKKFIEGFYAQHPELASSLDAPKVDSAFREYLRKENVYNWFNHFPEIQSYLKQLV